MLGQLIKKEILEHLMSLRFAIACLLCLMVVLSSLFVRCQDYSQVLDDFYQETAMEETRLNSIDRPWSLPWRGLTVYARPNPLKIFVRGVDDTNGLAVQINQDQCRPIVRDLQNTSVPLFPSIDLVTFVGLIMSLMAIVFGYDAICGEKDRGTLRLMLSYNVPRHLVLISKWIGGYVTLIVPFLMTFIVGVVIVLIQGRSANFALDQSQWMQLMVIAGLAMLYVAAMYSLAIFVSVLTARPATSVMLLLSLWVVTVLAIPNLSPYMAAALCPTQGAQVTETQKTALARQAERDREDKYKEYRTKKGIPDKWWETVNFGDYKQMEPIYDMWCFEWPIRKDSALWLLNEREKVSQKYRQQLDAQMETSRWIGRVSPFSCFAMAATELADTGVMESRRYMGQLIDYQGKFSAYACDECLSMEKKYMANQGKNPGPWCQRRDNPLPKFNYVPPAGSDYARMVAPDVGILIGMIVIFFMLSYLKFLRYDVR